MGGLLLKPKIVEVGDTVQIYEIYYLCVEDDAFTSICASCALSKMRESCSEHECLKEKKQDRKGVHFLKIGKKLIRDKINFK